MKSAIFSERGAVNMTTLYVDAQKFWVKIFNSSWIGMSQSVPFDPVHLS